MSSSIGHALAGLIVYTVSSHFGLIKPSWKMALFFAFLAAMPDLDIIPIELFDLPRTEFHRSYTHCIWFAIVGGYLIAGLYQFLTRKPACHLVWLFPLTILTHALMDMCCLDLFPPEGVQLFWPFSQAYTYTPMPLMASVGTFIAQQNPMRVAIFKAVSQELLVFGTLYVLTLLILKIPRLLKRNQP